MKTIKNNESAILPANTSVQQAHTKVKDIDTKNTLYPIFYVEPTYYWDQYHNHNPNSNKPQDINNFYKQPGTGWSNTGSLISDPKVINTFSHLGFYCKQGTHNPQFVSFGPYTPINKTNYIYHCVCNYFIDLNGIDDPNQLIITLDLYSLKQNKIFSTYQVFRKDYNSLTGFYSSFIDFLNDDATSPNIDDLELRTYWHGVGQFWFVQNTCHRVIP